MSHTTKLKTEVRNAQAIREAAKELGIELLTDAVPRMYYANQHGRCDFVLKLKGKYDVGLVKEGSGYALVYDSWDGHVAAELGNSKATANKPVAKFLQTYAKHAAMLAARAKGYMVQGCTTDAQGNVQLTLAVPG